ncbi:MAG: hypothetical protein WCD49_10815 [Candidatus Acidiferrales bacterium]
MSVWPPGFLPRTMLRIVNISAALLILPSAFGQAPPPIVEYKEVVPISSGQIRDGKICVNFNPVMTAGDFFDGLERRETASGDEFRKSSQVVRNFPEQITVQVQTFITVCDADIYTAAPLPPFFNGIQFKAQWKRGLAMRAVSQVTVQRVIFASEDGNNRLMFLLKIRDHDVPLTDHLIISVLSQQGKLLSRMSGKL